MERAFDCELCSEEFDSLDKLNAHIEREHGRISDSKIKKIKCNLCGSKFTRKESLTYHMRAHTGERPFKCHVNACGMTFKQESTLKIHIQLKHSDERPLKCDFPGCLYKSKTSWELRRHKKVHSDKRPFACQHSGCHFRAKLQHYLSRHTANGHCESKTWTCSKCKYRTRNASRLSRHVIVHEGKHENIPCSIDGCDYKGKNSEALKYHLRRHKKLLPCPISGCGKFLANKEALKSHVKLHNPSGRAFQCPLCFKFFPTLARLQEHCAVHTNEKQFQCGHCEHAAARQDGVKTHVSSVHAGIEFPYMVHLLDDRECLRCKVILPSAEFVVHCKGHAVM